MNYEMGELGNEVLFERLGFRNHSDIIPFLIYVLIC